MDRLDKEWQEFSKTDTMEKWATRVRELLAEIQEKRLEVSRIGIEILKINPVDWEESVDKYLEKKR